MEIKRQELKRCKEERYIFLQDIPRGVVVEMKKDTINLKDTKRNGLFYCKTPIRFSYVH